MPLDSPAVLLVEFWKGAGPAREFRTATLGAPDSIPPLGEVIVDPATGGMYGLGPSQIHAHLVPCGKPQTGRSGTHQ